jgi:hypothetical protein
MSSEHIDGWRNYLTVQLHEQYGVAKTEAQRIAAG